MFALAVTAMTFTACQDVPMPFDEPIPGQNVPEDNQNVTPAVPTGTGTLEDPFNAAMANKVINEGNFDANTIYYVKGRVSDIKEIDTGNYGNATWWLSDDGTTNNQFEIYRGYGMNGDKFTSADQLVKGDTMVVAGKLVQYNGTNEMAQGGKIVFRNGQSAGPAVETPLADPVGTGTAADPYNVSKVLQITKAGTYDENAEVYIKGIVHKIQSIDTSNYGNATYYISDNGEAANDFEIFRGMYINGDKFTSADQLKVGQTVVVCGKIIKYKETFELAQGNKLISVTGEGKTEETTPTPTPATTEGLSIDGTTVTLTASGVTAGTNSATVSLEGKGTNGAELKSVELSDGSVVTFDANGQKNGPKYYDGTKGVRLYAGNKINFACKNKIAKIVLTCDTFTKDGKTTNYVGNETATITFNGNDAEYVNVFTGTSGGGVQLRVQTITVYYAK